VRMDDLDPPRVEPGAADDILRTLEGFGLEWDGPVIYQSDRLDRYQEVMDELHQRDLIFPCSCTRKNLQGLSVYPGTCRNRKGIDQRSWRMKVPSGRLQWTDRAMGEQSVAVEAEIGDFLIKGAHGFFTYHFANAIDDFDHSISDVVRGADLLGSTANELLVYRAFKMQNLRFMHLPLALNELGNKLSKQTMAQPVEANEASRHINDVLLHLGLEKVELDEPKIMLTSSIAQWNRGRI